MARGRRPPEKLAAEKLGGCPIRRDRTAAVAHICRAASGGAPAPGELRSARPRPDLDGVRHASRRPLQADEHDEERRRELPGGSEPAPRRSGRRPKA
ncbi:hypothetical protein ACIP2Y_08670 [Streptomyces sviceus]|uniref:hypothetical protein n=1 Tax=Streptomyces sviceus TaxID=285530 RepID=UPI0037FC427E